MGNCSQGRRGRWTDWSMGQNFSRRNPDNQARYPAAAAGEYPGNPGNNALYQVPVLAMQQGGMVGLVGFVVGVRGGRERGSREGVKKGRQGGPGLQAMSPVLLFDWLCFGVASLGGELSVA